MRIGIVSDVHGNAAGLATALARMGDVDEVLCVGDVVEDFRFSNDAVSLLRDRGARCVKGNHDTGVFAPHASRVREAPHVRSGHLSWLAEQPLLIEATIGGKKLVMTHASPFAPHNQYVFPHSPELKRFADVDADYVVIGHTHAQMVQRVGTTLVINPGSVGQAVDHRNGRQLSYAVLDTSTDEVVFDDYMIANT